MNKQKLLSLLIGQQGTMYIPIGNKITIQVPAGGTLNYTFTENMYIFETKVTTLASRAKLTFPNGTVLQDWWIASNEKDTLAMPCMFIPKGTKFTSYSMGGYMVPTFIGWKAVPLEEVL